MRERENEREPLNEFKDLALTEPNDDDVYKHTKFFHFSFSCVAFAIFLLLCFSFLSLSQLPAEVKDTRTYESQRTHPWTF